MENVSIQKGVTKMDQLQEKLIVLKIMMKNEKAVSRYEARLNGKKTAWQAMAKTTYNKRMTQGSN